MSAHVSLRVFKLLVIVGFPFFGFLYAYQFTNQPREVVVPFHPFRAPPEPVKAAGDDLAKEPGVLGTIPFKAPVTVVNFWATWCPPCQEEFPAMMEMQRQLDGKGVELIFVSIDQDWAAVPRFLTQNHIDLAPGRLFWDPQKLASAKWGSEKFPETYVVRRDGWVVEKIIGAQQWTRPAVIRYFEELAVKFARVGLDPVSRHE